MALPGRVARQVQDIGADWLGAGLGAEGDLIGPTARGRSRLEVDLMTGSLFVQGGIDECVVKLRLIEDALDFWMMLYLLVVIGAIPPPHQSMAIRTVNTPGEPPTPEALETRNPQRPATPALGVGAGASAFGYPSAAVGSSW